MAAYSGCGEGDGGIGHGKRRSRTGLARVGGDVGSVADGRRQAGSGMARSRARVRLNFSSQGQRLGRCRVSRRAERVSRPAREKNRRRRVLVFTICSPRPMRVVQRARLCAITCTAVGGEAARGEMAQPYAFHVQHDFFRSRYIDMGFIDHIDQVTVSMDGRDLPVETGRSGRKFQIGWEHRSVSAPETLTFVLRYRVRGGMRLGEEYYQ